MAEPATRARRDRREASEDSIEAEFGGDYSEASLEALRYLGRKGAEFGEIDKSEAEALQPPSQAECDAAVAALQEYEQSLEQLRQYVPTEKERAWVDYKRALVQDASPEELTWLKLKAYHHGMDALRASRGEDAAGDVDAPPLNPAPTSGPSTHSCSSGDAARDAVLRAVRELLPSSGEGSEDQYRDQHPAAADIGRLASHLQATSSSSSNSNRGGGVRSTLPPQEQQPTHLASTAPAPSARYHPDYLEEERLLRQLAQQRQQRSQAFVLSLAAALGVSVVRWWLRRGRGGRAADAAGAKRPLTPVPQ